MFFSKYFSFKQSLIDRIEQLNRMVEMQSGELSVLSRQLARAQAKEDDLLQKIFRMSGVEKQTQTIQPVERKTTTDVIKLANSRVPWAQARRTLEQEAQAQYWLEKKAKQDAEKSQDFFDKINESELDDKIS